MPVYAIEARCRVNASFRVGCAGLEPDHMAIAGLGGDPPAGGGSDSEAPRAIRLIRRRRGVFNNRFYPVHLFQACPSLGDSPLSPERSLFSRAARAKCRICSLTSSARGSG